MKTLGGYIIESFVKLEKPILNGILEPHIYQGIIKNVPMSDNDEDFLVTWDKFGRCNNNARKDCYIDVKTIK